MFLRPVAVGVVLSCIASVLFTRPCPLAICPHLSPPPFRGQASPWHASASRVSRAHRSPPMLLFSAAAPVGQWLPVDPRIEESEPLAITYPGEVCSWYDVRRLLWKPHACAAGAVCEPDVARWPRLGEIFTRPGHLPNASVCDGYGVRHVRRR